MWQGVGAMDVNWEAVAAIVALMGLIGGGLWRLYERRDKKKQRNKAKQQALLDERQAELGEKESLAEHWQERAGALTAALGTLSAGDERLEAAGDAFEELQGMAQGELHPAFGRDSALVCAERHIRALMEAALGVAEEAVTSANAEVRKKAQQRLDELNSDGIDTMRWEVFDVEYRAWHDDPNRDLTQPASTVSARAQLAKLVRQNCSKPVDCDLMAGADPD